MFATRKVYDLELPVTSTLSDVYTELTKQIGQEVIENLTNPKFYYPMVFSR